MDKGGPPVGVQSDRGVEREGVTESQGDIGGRLHGDDGDENAGLDSSDMVDRLPCVIERSWRREGGCNRERGDTGGRLHGDDGDENAGLDSSDFGNIGEAPDKDTIDRVIVGVCTTDVEGGLQGVHDTSQMGDVVMEEEAGLRTDRERSDSGAIRSFVMKVGVHAREEARSAPPQDVEGDMSLVLIVRPPSTFYADDDHTG
ncbi:hypothetical protein CBR_g38794 [Chara braunii]|uniref:Uncharacterized protein n=1 Tax=Chara braunii TaxID=69332 RepID=A0A388LQP2_CHABU|nr:hypothetical protein CBR_g38794 [Chara braunii]|eukprot:GBG84512.1 hypothetical protein CBR_g38794 [Chara braunii]